MSHYYEATSSHGTLQLHFAAPDTRASRDSAITMVNGCLVSNARSTHSAGNTINTDIAASCTVIKLERKSDHMVLLQRAESQCNTAYI